MLDHIFMLTESKLLSSELRHLQIHFLFVNAIVSRARPVAELDSIVTDWLVLYVCLQITSQTTSLCPLATS